MDNVNISFHFMCIWLINVFRGSLGVSCDILEIINYPSLWLYACPVNFVYYKQNVTVFTAYVNTHAVKLSLSTLPINIFNSNPRIRILFYITDLFLLLLLLLLLLLISLLLLRTALLV